MEIKADVEKAFFTGVYANSPRTMRGALNFVMAEHTIDASAGALTQDHVLDAIEKLYERGVQGQIYLFCNPSTKRKINKLFGSEGTTIQITPGENKGVSIGIDKIYTDFGVVNLVMATAMPADSIFIAPLEAMEIAMLREPEFSELAKTGDAERGMVVTELCIKVQQSFVAKVINFA